MRAGWRRCAIGLALAVAGWGGFALAPAQTSPPAQSAAASEPGNSVLRSLNAPWQFAQGDDPAWARPDFDDAHWLTIRLDRPLVEQGATPYSGAAWYRLRLEPVTASQPIDLMAVPASTGQLSLYLDGAQIGWTTGLAHGQTELLSPPAVVHLPADSRPHLLAIRAWAGPTASIRTGLLQQVLAGPPQMIAAQQTLLADRHWDESALTPMIAGFLFLVVAGLGAVLYLAQRHHSEYLWLTLLCLTVTATAAADTTFGLGVLTREAVRLADLWTGHLFMAVTLEFLLRFTASRRRRPVRIGQALVLLPALVGTPAVLASRPSSMTSALSVTAEVIFCLLAAILLLGAWRRGKRDAGVMLGPFLLAALGDSITTLLDYAAYLGLLPARFANPKITLGPVVIEAGTIAFLIFLASLVAVILYRFVRVSQEEQRSSAEIAAARSVQAMLIPTELPSNRHFLLESAYLPINGVGGDFFQVLPLADESLLLVAGDVSGKGLQAAMNSSSLVGALRNELAHEPAVILEHLNRVMLGAGGARPGRESSLSFATCLCARIHPDGRMILANAGHLSPFRDGREMELMPSLPLGIVPEPGYTQQQFQLRRGERLVFLSDGVVEAADAHGELFGFERTQQLANEPPLYIAQTAKRFGQTDDITVISLYLASPLAPVA